MSEKAVYKPSDYLYWSLTDRCPNCGELLYVAGWAKYATHPTIHADFTCSVCGKSYSIEGALSERIGCSKVSGV